MTATKNPRKAKATPKRGRAVSKADARLPTLARGQRKATAPGRATDTAAKTAPRPRVKQLWSIDYASIGTDNIKRELVVTFTFDGEKVKTEWHKPNHPMRQYIEEDGICVAAGVFRPADGEPFFENLALSFSRSTTVDVVDVTETTVEE